jgi:hypothetical protein
MSFIARLILLCPFGALAFILVATASADDAATLKAVFDAWARRQEQTRSAKFEWTMEASEVYDFPFPEEHSREGTPKRGDMVRFQKTASMRLDGDKVDYRVRIPDGSRLSMAPFHRSASDGTVSQEYNESGDSSIHSSGIIRPKPHAFDTNSVYNRPILLTYRPLHPTILGLRRDQYRIAAVSGTIDGHSCIVVEETGDGPIRKSYWVDPKREYIVLRYASKVEGKDRTRQDIQYEQRGDYGWVPVYWKTVALRESGRFDESTECRVTNCSVNEPLAAAEFQITFPAGTMVLDEVHGREYLIERSWWRDWLWPGAAVFVFGVIALWLWRRRRRVS